MKTEIEDFVRDVALAEVNANSDIEVMERFIDDTVGKAQGLLAKLNASQQAGAQAKPYTVLLLKPDYVLNLNFAARQPGDETHLVHITAGSVKEAVAAAQKEAWTKEGSRDDDFPGHYDSLMVIEGHHHDISRSAPTASTLLIPEPIKSVERRRPRM